MKRAQGGGQPRSSPSLPFHRQQFVFSHFSTRAVPDSGWASPDFMLGAGMVVIQPATNKMVIIKDTRTKHWILPRGRKDIGESLEQTALREAFEETGYEVDFLPMHMVHRQPYAPKDRDKWPLKVTEPIFISTMTWKAKYDLGGKLKDGGGEYLISWYVGQIPENAVHHKGVCMPDEQEYVSHIVSFDEALRLLSSEAEIRVVKFATELYQYHLQFEQELANSASSQGTTEIEGQVQNMAL
ncbi:hypothetical protein E1B28_013691 [Marasmius oreades]|uniref:Nudix hydrolase domain-containing protein n=1 Tax=Marasmius oreades TaxID=181124 RepID=A0A9P7RQC5_9AGAR|nr:uncharacterized protein E1B28_013691 [Marasmius oreades]KAG7087750.1 hypothetical protein E1B28_013691 [Marasmius oreades]